MDLIDRQALLDHLNECLAEEYDRPYITDAVTIAIKCFVEQMPSIEPKRVRCSSCRKVYVQPVAGAHHCPFCAKWDKWIEWDGEDDEYYPPETVTNMREVFPKKRGEWVDVHGRKAQVEIEGSNIYPIDAHCSACGNWLEGSDEYKVSGNFCPHCGEDMRKPD